MSSDDDDFEDSEKQPRNTGVGGKRKEPSKSSYSHSEEEEEENGEEKKEMKKPHLEKDISKEKPKKKKKKRPKDKSPSKPPSAYVYFLKEHQSKVKEELKQSGEKMNPGLLTKIIGGRWKQLTDSEKAFYKDQAEKGKLEFEKEKEASFEHIQKIPPLNQTFDYIASSMESDVRIFKVRRKGDHYFRRISIQKDDLTLENLIKRIKLKLEEISEIDQLFELPNVLIKDTSDLQFIKNDAELEYTLVP